MARVDAGLKLERGIDPEVDGRVLIDRGRLLDPLAGGGA